ncbi:MAG: sulfatase-like hydrolase/transferase [Bacteroidales bacterium]|nr:sulfatase-like hydrolase/transferase [Bacteroidales bacterium]
MNNIKKTNLLFYICLLFCINGAYAQETEKAPAGIKHVFVVGIDAMSTQGMEKANTPNMDYMIKNGSICRSVRTVIPSSSSPNWSSMLTGAGVEAHGVTSNDWRPGNYSIQPVGVTEYGLFPTIVDVVRKQLPTDKIGMIYQWSGFGNLFEKGVANVDKSYETEIGTAEALAEYIRTEKPTFTFTQLDDVDHCGHTYGHMTEKYLKAIEDADRCVGMVLKAVKDAGIEDESLVIIVADHGGVGYSHGGESWEEMTVPFILCGRNIKKGFEIQQQTYMFDVAPTIAYALGIDVPSAWYGRPMRSAFEGVKIKTDPIVFRKQSYGPRINGGRHLFEQAGGLFVDKEAVVTIEPYHKGDKVYFTTDGSVPTKQSSLYQAPFKLDKSTVVKAKAYSANGDQSIVSNGYFRIIHKNPKNGVNVAFYQGGNWNSLPSFKDEKSESRWTADEIHVDNKQIAGLLRPGNSIFGLVYSTFIQIDEPGTYHFFLQSDDGSKLYIDGSKVVDDDGAHGLIEREGSVELTKGRHALTVEFFNAGGGFWIDAFYQGPGIPKQIIPADKLFKFRK